MNNNFKDQETFTRLTRSRIQLLMSYPFFGTLALHLNLIEEYGIETAGVDGKNFYYNPEFFKSLSDAELSWVIAHEVMHCALGHIWRRGMREHQKFNVACDYAIHCILKEVESSDFKMPKVGLYDPKFNDKSSEEIYSILPEPPKGQSQDGSGKGDGDGSNQSGNQKGQGSPNSGQKTLDDHSMWDKSETKQNAQEKQREWQEKMMNAAEVAQGKNKGNMPGSLERLLGRLKKPQKNWKELLAEFVQFETFDYGFNPPDKRYASFSDCLMPDYSEQTEKVQDIIFVIDTSGSISDKEISIFYSELVGMMDQFNNCVKGHIWFCDTHVAAKYAFEDVDDILKCKPAGGGGTEMEAAIQEAIRCMDQENLDVAGMCVLTDAYDSYSMKEHQIPFKMLWLVTNESQTPPYGQVGRLKI